VKLLFDHNLSPQLVSLLKDIIPEASHVHNLGLDKKDDLEIWTYAKEHGFTIVSKDSDFNDLSTLLTYPPKFVWIRRDNCKTKDIETLLRQHFSDIKQLHEDDGLGVLVLI
jgi:predicted nuclease of predicted toxin-antitoxin system